MQYRKHRQPLVPRRLTRGATERIDMFGQRRHPALRARGRAAACASCSPQGIESLAIVFLHSFTNPAPRGARRRDRPQGASREAERDIPLAISSQVAPTMREVSRANATVIQAYAVGARPQAARYASRRSSPSTATRTRSRPCSATAASPTSATRASSRPSCRVPSAASWAGTISRRRSASRTSSAPTWAAPASTPAPSPRASCRSTASRRSSRCT